MTQYSALGELVGRVEERIYPLVEHIVDWLGFNEVEEEEAEPEEGGVASNVVPANGYERGHRYSAPTLRLDDVRRSERRG